MAIGDVFDLNDIKAFQWADFAVRCGIERRLLARKMRRMAKAVQQRLPALASNPVYLDDEKVLLNKVQAFIVRQAVALEEVANTVTKVNAADLGGG